MVKCKDCAYLQGGSSKGKDMSEVDCFRRGKFIVKENINRYDDIERECNSFYRKIPNFIPAQAFELQREEQLKGREFAYMEKALDLSKEANDIAKEANKLSYDSRLLSWLAIAVSVLTFIAWYFKK